MTAPEPQPTPEYPRLETERLILRAFEDRDVPAIVECCADPEIAINLFLSPFPYTEQDGRDWVAKSREMWNSQSALSFACESRETGEYVGSMGLKLELSQGRAEIGYALCRNYWGQGLAAEAGRRVIAHAFEVLNLRRLHAGYYHWNPKSGRVLEKLGMKPEGMMRAHVVRMGRVADLMLVGLLREEWVGRA